MRMSQLVGYTIESNANAISYGKTEKEVADHLTTEGWTEYQVAQLLRAIRWRMNTQVAI